MLPAQPFDPGSKFEERVLIAHRRKTLLSHQTGISQTHIAGDVRSILPGLSGRHQCANPVLLIDEIDKAKESSNNGHIWTTLLSMLNGDGHYFDSCLITNIDLRFVNFWATANDLNELPRPLLDRFITIQMPSPNIEHAEDIIDSIVRDHLAHIGSDTAPELPSLMRQRLATILISKKGSIRKMQQAYAEWLRAQALQRALPNLDLKCRTLADVVHLPHQTDRLH